MPPSGGWIMAIRKRAGALSAHEKRIVKALLAKGWRNQDIQALVNIDLAATVNGARITGVKQNQAQQAATDEEVELFQIKSVRSMPGQGSTFSTTKG